MEKAELLEESTGGPKCCAGGISSPTGCYARRRYIIVALLFFGMVIVNAQRVNIGVTVIEFLEKTSDTNSENCTSNVSDRFINAVLLVLPNVSDAKPSIFKPSNISSWEVAIIAYNITI